MECMKEKMQLITKLQNENFERINKANEYKRKRLLEKYQSDKYRYCQQKLIKSNDKYHLIATLSKIR